MFTRNYATYRAGMLSSGYTMTIKDHNGADFKIATPPSPSHDLGANLHKPVCDGTSTIKQGVYFGRGNTPASFDDYTMEDIITAGLSVVSSCSFTVVARQGGGEEVARATYTITNTQLDAIVIREVGYFAEFDGSVALFDRHTLETPVTIQPGETKIMTYQVVFNHGIAEWAQL